LYINILKDLIRGKYDPASFYIPHGQETRPIVRADDGENGLTLSTIFDIEKFKTFWSKKELDRLCGQFNGCFKNQGEVEEVIFSAPDPMKGNDAFNFLINTTGSHIPDDDGSSIRDDDNTMSSSLIDSTLIQMSATPPSTSPPKEDSFQLPEPNNQSLPIVKGLVVSIIEILDAMDQRFSAVLTQSMQGISK
jgi:hypothetical protein